MDDVIYVVETEDDIFLGFITFVDGGVVIRTGYPGHPRYVSSEDIVQLLPAHLHPAVTTDVYISAI